jgi:hypothetical protein
MFTFIELFWAIGSLSLVHSTQDNPVLEVPGYGILTGKIIKTSGLLGRQPKDYYAYRNLTYAKSVSGKKRFLVGPTYISQISIKYNFYIFYYQQSELFDGPLANQSHDATQTGPVCPQSGISDIADFLGVSINLLLEFVWVTSITNLFFLSKINNLFVLKAWSFRGYSNDCPSCLWSKPQREIRFRSPS